MRRRVRACSTTQRVSAEFHATCGTWLRDGTFASIGKSQMIRRRAMLGWALIFFILAVVAGWLGFFGLAGVAAGIAKVLFLIFLVLLVLSFLVRALRGESVL
jgi:uncharacterized membrane protein YtjA (UPF0391 family)